jgi:cytochrome c553
MNPVHARFLAGAVARDAARAALCAAVSSLTLLTPTSAQVQTPAPDVIAALAARADPARGQAAFRGCVPCHRNDGLGRPKADIPRLAGQHASVVIKQLSDIRAGRRSNESMKPVVEDPSFTTQVMADIAAHLQRLPVPSGTDKGPGRGVVRGRALYDKDCAVCHGAAGDGSAATFVPMVAAQHHGYLLRELELIRSGERGNSNAEMVKVVKAYTNADLEAVADYMAHLPAPPR